MADSPPPRTSDRAVLEPGTAVEVHTGFDRSWSGGFNIEEVSDIGYRLRRRSDDSLLPAVFPFNDVRRERKSSLWWI